MDMSRRRHNWNTFVDPSTKLVTGFAGQSRRGTHGTRHDAPGTCAPPRRGSSGSAGGRPSGWSNVGRTNNRKNRTSGTCVSVVSMRKRACTILLREPQALATQRQGAGTGVPRHPVNLKLEDNPADTATCKMSCNVKRRWSGLGHVTPEYRRPLTAVMVCAQARTRSFRSERSLPPPAGFKSVRAPQTECICVH